MSESRSRTGGVSRVPVVVSGSSGFIGSHLCAQLAKQDSKGGTICGIDRRPAGPSAEYRHHHADISQATQLDEIAPDGAQVLYHLAAEAEVLTPFESIPGFVDSNVTGTFNVLNRLAPEMLVFASSSAVYGTARRGSVTTHWSHVNPLGIYGMSKAMCELICRDWARDANRPAVAFRFGNVIGPGCRGLIPFLVDHAQRHPEGGPPARCRGGGRIVRDYLPVGYLVRLLARVPDLPWKAGELRIFNVGTGRPLTNGDVGGIVQAHLRSRGYALEIDWTTPIPAAESRAVVLDVKQTVNRFDIPIPSDDEVVATIEDAARACLEGAVA